MGPSIGPCWAPSFPHTELETPRSFLVQLPHSSDEETVPERGSDTPKVTLCGSDKTWVRSDLRPLPSPAPQSLSWAGLRLRTRVCPGPQTPLVAPGRGAGAGAARVEAGPALTPPLRLRSPSRTMWT